MTAIAITGMGLTGVLRLTWVHDNLAHVLDHSQHRRDLRYAWTGLACPGHGLALGADVDNATLRQLAAGARSRTSSGKPPTSSPPNTPRYSRPPCARITPATPERADRLWENLQAIWSQAWSANYAVLEFMQNTGLTRFAPVKPQHWVVASFEHHTSPHGLPRPHIHNIALPSLTTAANAR